MDRKQIVIIVLLLLVISILIPFLFNSSNETIQTISSIISSISSIITLILVLSLYSKYGIEKTLIEKQKETIFEFLQELSKVNFKIETNMFSGPFRPLYFNIIDYETYYNYRVMVNDDYIDVVSKITNYSEHLFMPKEIAIKLNQIKPWIVRRENIEQITNFVKLRTYNSSSQKEEQSFYNKFGNKEYTLFEYLNLWEEIVNECKAWVLKNSTKKIELNIK